MQSIRIFHSTALFILGLSLSKWSWYLQGAVALEVRSVRARKIVDCMDEKSTKFGFCTLPSRYIDNTWCQFVMSHCSGNGLPSDK